MFRYFFVLLFTCSYATAQKGKVILAVFAHPDDEGTVGPVLAKYAAEGASVYLAVATDGRLGVTIHAHIPAGDSLAQIRSEEIKCATEQLGIHLPILMGLHDQLDAQQGYKTENLALDSIRKTFFKLMINLQPDVVLTWGPGGWTGHPDHRLVGDIVTEVFSSRHWNKNPKLYFAEIPTGNLSSDAPNIATVDSSYLTVAISLQAAEMAKAKAALMCHRSQYTPEEMEKLHRIPWNPNHPIAYFRPFIFTGKKQQSLFQ
jgi:LmbE family N-acetylglucosaminyl deacetylase